MILHKYLLPISLHQTAIAPHHPQPDRLFLKSNSDRPSSPTKPDRQNLHLKM